MQHLVTDGQRSTRGVAAPQKMRHEDLINERGLETSFIAMQSSWTLTRTTGSGCTGIT